MLLSLFLVASLNAGVHEDLATAADGDLPTDLRRAAFDRVAASGSVEPMMKVIRDPNTSPTARWVAVRSLGLMKEMAARDALVELLGSPTAVIRIAVLGAMADRADRTLVGRIGGRLEDKALLVRAAAAEALGRLGDPASIADLARALAADDARQNGTSLWIRRTYVEAIASIGGDDAARALGRALADTDVEVVDAAVGGLERIAGFDYREGRSRPEQLEAWRRWAGSRGR